MAEKKIRSDVYQARSTFFTQVGGRLMRVGAGDTVVAGHPVLRGRMDKFTPWSPTHPLPEAPAQDPASAPEPSPEPEAET